MGKYAVLVVESHPTLQKLIGEYFEGQEMVVWTASSCDEALSLLEQFQPDLIFSDIEFSDGDAYSFLKQWRLCESANRWDPIPAIAMSGLDWLEHVPQACAAGFQAYIEKPFDPERLLKVMERLLCNQQEMRKAWGVQIECDRLINYQKGGR